MANYRTKDIGNVKGAVYLYDLPLKNGIVDSTQISVPYIHPSAVASLLAMDKSFNGTGERYKITSAMGSGHNPGAYSHGNGWKIDMAPINGTRFKPNTEKMLNRYVGNGAIGFHDNGSGPHYDLGFSRMAGNQPGIINAKPDIMNLYQGGQMNSAQMYDYMMQKQQALAKQYDLARALQSGEQGINNAVQRSVPQINEQMYQNVDDPITFQMEQQKANLQNDIARLNAQNNITQAQLEYMNRPQPQQMANDYNAQLQRFLEYMNQQNPYIANQGQVEPLNIDEKAYARQAALDRAVPNVFGARAMMHANTNPQLAAMEMQIARNGQAIAEQQLRDAQNRYLIRLSNKTGIPPEQLAAQAQHSMKMAEALAPGASSAYKESQILQPNQNLRTYMQEIPEVSEKVYRDTIIDQAGRMDDLLDRNKFYQSQNLPGANVMVQGTSDITGAYGKYPQQVLGKYQTEANAISKPNSAVIQSNASMTGHAMDDVQKNAYNINNMNIKAYQEQQKNLREQLKQQAEASDGARVGDDKTKQSNLKIEQQKQALANQILKQLIDPNTGLPAANSMDTFVQALKQTKQFTNQEIATLVMLNYKRGE